MQPNFDFNQRPFLVIWETTQACDLACVHCRASAQPLRNPLELSTPEAKRLIADIAQLAPPLFVLTGGDPLKRPDIYELVEYAASLGLRVSMSPSATPLLTREAIVELKRRGLVRLAISLDGPTPEVHDNFRRVAGTFERAVAAVRWAQEIALPVQINSTIARPNLEHVDALIALLETMEIVLWSVFFLVPTGRGRLDDLVSAEEFEQVFAKLCETRKRVSFDIKTTEAQHYRRFVLQRRVEERKLGQSEGAAHPFAPVTTLDGIGRAPRGINDGKGFVFVSHTGEIYPSGFLPLAEGNVRRQSLAEVYRNSPLFQALRDPARLEGKCGRCEFHDLCGGSRSRAYALTGNVFAEEPCCVYQPKRAALPAQESVTLAT